MDLIESLKNHIKKNMGNSHPFFIPNLDKNIKVEELNNGIGVRLIYTLSCDKTYPHKTFYSSGKWYVSRHIDILYSVFMNDRINKAYIQLKNSTMLELALWKHQQILLKIKQLQNNLNTL